MPLLTQFIFFFVNDTATTEIYTLSLHDALPISFERTLEVNLLGVWRTVRACLPHVIERRGYVLVIASMAAALHGAGDRKSTRLNSSHANISYAVFCLKKKKNTQRPHGCPGRL